MTKKRALTVKIHHDPDVDNPCSEEGAWSLHSFSRRHASYRDPEDFFPDGVPHLDLHQQLEAGTAWILSYFEHGLCEWMLHDEPRGALAGDWRWDGVDVAGVLVWENPVDDLGPRTKEDRRKDAAAFVETYTQWVNGETFGYEIFDAEGHHLCEGWFFIGVDQLIWGVREALEDGDEVVEVRDLVAGLTPEHFRAGGNGK